MFEKLDTLPIIRDHIHTLVNHKTGEILKKDLVTFFGLPFLIALALSLFINSGLMDTAVANVLITSLSVFSALLFNLLLLIYDIVRKEDSQLKAVPRRGTIKRFLKEIFANISYSIFISVVCIIFLLLLYLQVGSIWYYRVLSFISYYLIVSFLLTLFMVLKRVHILLKQEIEAEPDSQ